MNTHNLPGMTTHNSKKADVGTLALSLKCIYEAKATLEKTRAELQTFANGQSTYDRVEDHIQACHNLLSAAIKTRRQEIQIMASAVQQSQPTRE